MIHPVTNRPADKRSFIPSLIEKQKVKTIKSLQRFYFVILTLPVCLTCPQVSKLVHAIKMGWIKPRRVEDDSKGHYYDLWASEDTSILARLKMHLPAPKTRLPGHEESYNPPPEYLFTEEEVCDHSLHLFNKDVRVDICFHACRLVFPFPASSVGSAGSVGQEAAVHSQEVLQSSSGSSVFSFYPREVWALPGSLPVSPTKEDEGNYRLFSLLSTRGSCVLFLWRYWLSLPAGERESWRSDSQTSQTKRPAAFSDNSVPGKNTPPLNTESTDDFKLLTVFVALIITRVFRCTEVTVVWFGPSVCLHQDSGLLQVPSCIQLNIYPHSFWLLFFSLLIIL